MGAVFQDAENERETAVSHRVRYLTAPLNHVCKQFLAASVTVFTDMETEAQKV